MFTLIKYAYLPFKSHFKLIFLLLMFFLVINLAGPHLPRPLAVYTVYFALCLFLVYYFVLIQFVISKATAPLELLYLQIPQPPSKTLVAYILLVFLAVFLGVVLLVSFFPVYPYLMPHGLTFVVVLNILTLALYGVVFSLAFTLLLTTLVASPILAINKWLLVPAGLLMLIVTGFLGGSIIFGAIKNVLYPIGSFIDGEILTEYVSVLQTPLDIALKNFGLVFLLIAALFVSIIYLIKNKLNLPTQ